jgi:hypothetical protein
VRRVRHAAALDERRALFQMTGWGDCHPQVKEVWFAGDHADVGGGHRGGNSPLTDASLAWMLGEATQAGLAIDPARRCDVQRIVKRTAEAPMTRARDLWIRSGFIFLDLAPRVELVNAVYPPARRTRFFCLNGRRKPGDHAIRGEVYVHHSVAARWQQGDAAYSRERLTRATRSRAAISLQTARDLEVR